MPDDPVGLDPDLADAFRRPVGRGRRRLEDREAAANAAAAALWLSAVAAVPCEALASAAASCRAAADELASRAGRMRDVLWSPVLTDVAAALGVDAPAEVAWGWGGARPARDDDDDGDDDAEDADEVVVDLDDIDLEEVAEDIYEGFEDTDFGTYGVCAEASGGSGGVSGELGACIVSTPDDNGLIIYDGLGRTYGTPSAAVAAGTMASNARTTSDLEGPAVCISGTAGLEAVGVTGSLCASVDEHAVPTGVYVVSAGVAATSPGASGSISVVQSDVALSDGGALRIVRTPVEVVAEAAEDWLEEFEDGLGCLVHWPRRC